MRISLIAGIIAAAILPAQSHAGLRAQGLVLAPAGHGLARSATEACQALAKRTEFDGKPLVRRLGDLPEAWLEHAVYRLVDGCPVREIVYRGQVYYVPPAGRVATTVQPIMPAAPGQRQPAP